MHSDMQEEVETQCSTQLPIPSSGPHSNPKAPFRKAKVNLSLVIGAGLKGTYVVKICVHAIGH